MPTTGWIIEVSSPPERVAESVLAGFRRYGWPAIQAAMDSPGFPPDPHAGWARTFPRADDNRRGDGPPSLDAIAWVLQPTGRSADKWFAKLDVHSVGRRQDALRMMDEEAADDPRRLPALLDRLARDPSPEVRENAAAALASRGREATVQRALRDTADHDEDLQVRWAARRDLRK